MWLAHALTLSRLVLAVLFWPVARDPGPAFIVMAVAGATDLIDGYIARYVIRRRQRAGQPAPSTIGEWLDPLCDKTFVLSVLVALLVVVKMPLELLALIATREIILVPLAILYRFTPLLRSRMRYRFRAGVLGKAATVAQFAAMTAVLFGHPLMTVLAGVAALVGAAAALAYIMRGVRLAREAEGARVGR